MSAVNDGGPAFPYFGHTGWSGQGMSLRDYFAAKAMQGFISGHFSHYGHESYWPRAEIASEAYAMADAMLKARSS